MSDDRIPDSVLQALRQKALENDLLMERVAEFYCENADRLLAEAGLDGDAVDRTLDGILRRVQARVAGEPTVAVAASSTLRGATGWVRQTASSIADALFEAIQDAIAPAHRVAVLGGSGVECNVVERGAVRPERLPIELSVAVYAQGSGDYELVARVATTDERAVERFESWYATPELDLEDGRVVRLPSFALERSNTGSGLGGEGVFGLRVRSLPTGQVVNRERIRVVLSSDCLVEKVER